MSKEYTRALTTLGVIPVAGQIIFHDNFEHNLNFNKAGTGGDFIFELDPSIAYSGKQSLKLKTRTDGAAGNDNITAQLFTHLTPSKHLIASGRFLSSDFDKFLELNLDFLFYDGTTLLSAQIQHLPATPIWSYYHHDVGYTAITGSTAQPYASGWHFYQIAIDYAQGLYKSFQIDDQLFSLANLPLKSELSGQRRHLNSWINIKTAGAAPADLNLDEFLLHEI